MASDELDLKENYLKQYEFSIEPIPRLSYTDPNAEKLIENMIISSTTFE